MNASGLLAELVKRWFILGIVAVIVAAKIQPLIGVKGGKVTSVQGIVLVYMVDCHMVHV